MFLANYLTFEFNKNFIRKVNAIIVFVSIIAGCILYLILLFAFRIKEVKSFFNYLTKN